MAKNIKDETLVDALSFCGVKELPEELKGKEVWIKAIALVTKRDGGQSYVAVERDSDGGKKIVRDFGSLSPVAKIEKLYPYMYLSENDVPKFAKDAKDEKIAWLEERDYKKEELEGLTPKGLDKIIINECVKVALNRNKKLNK